MNEQRITELKKALTDTAGQIHHMAADLGAENGDLQRQLQKTAEEIRHSVEQVWRAEMDAALGSIPSIPPKAEKALPLPEKAP